MSHIPGYSPNMGYQSASYQSYPGTPTNLGAAAPTTSYPNTYQTVRSSSNYSPVPSGNVTYRAQPGAGGRGRRGRGVQLPKNLRVFTCANKHPISALKELRADAQFETMCTYNTIIGAAIVVNTTIDGVVYQGEGTSAAIARAIAAHKALMGLNANEHSQVQQVVDYSEHKKLVMERITLWQDTQSKKQQKKQDDGSANSEEKAKKKEENKLKMEQMKADGAKKRAERKAAHELMIEEARKKKEARGEAQMSTDSSEKENEAEEGDQTNKKKKKNNGQSAPVPGQPHLDYNILIQRYGPDVAETTIQLEEKTEFGCVQFKCILTVQGHTFESVYTNKKGARNQAVDQAHSLFAESPPPVVNEKKRKLPPREPKTKFEGEFTPPEAIEFHDKLAEKCWSFVTDKISHIQDHLKIRRNLVVILKVEGKGELENCEPVAFGNGTLCVKIDNMTPDGTTINDCIGESLALRAFRRYLLDQIELCLGSKPSVYTRDRPSGKCSIKKAVKFYLYTNSCPMGDCRAVCTTKPVQPDLMDTETAPVVKAEPTDPAVPVVKTEPFEVKLEEGASAVIKEEENMETEQEADKPRTIKNWRPQRRGQGTRQEDLGKITFLAKNAGFGSSEVATLFNEEKSHCIVSPSDKLAVRQMCGVQGSILFNLTNPVYISHYFINRAFNLPSITRAVYGRVKDAKLPVSKEKRDLPIEPEFTKVFWKATRIEEKKSRWGLIWAEGHDVEILFALEGKQFHQKEGEQIVNYGDMKDKTAPSEFCTKNLFTAFSNVCKRFKKNYPEKYSVIKSANTRYRVTKNEVLGHLKNNGLGDWSVNPSKPDY